MTTDHVQATRPGRPPTRTWYIGLAQRAEGYWSQSYVMFEAEQLAVEWCIGEMRSTSWPARDYRVIAVDLPTVPAPPAPVESTRRNGEG